MARRVYTIKEIKEIVKAELEEDLQLLDQADRLVVEFPLKVEDYKLNHPKGALLVVYKGASYDKTKAANVIIQDRDMQIGVVCVIRKLMQNKEPEEWIDFVQQSLTGIELEVNRADRKVYPISEEWIKEEEGIWWYGITFITPNISVEKEILNN